LSFYFQPDPPQDRSHRREAIVAKDIVKQALKSAAASAKNGALHATSIASSIWPRTCAATPGERPSSPARAEFLEGVRTASAAGRHAHLSSAAFSVETAGRLAGSAARALRRRGRPPACPYLRPAARRPARTRSHCPHALAQRIELRLQRLRSRTCRATRVRGSAAAFQGVAERLRTDFEKGIWERLIVGCQDANWSEFESNLHPYVKQRLIGRFSADVASVSNEEIRDHAAVVLKRWITERASTKAIEAVDFAKSNGRGVTGLRRVLQALETGGVQSIFLTENYSAPAVECTHCGHIDAHLIASCVACGRATRQLTDVCDAIIPIAIRRDIELFYLKERATWTAPATSRRCCASAPIRPRDRSRRLRKGRTLVSSNDGDGPGRVPHSSRTLR